MLTRTHEKAKEQVPARNTLLYHQYQSILSGNPFSYDIRFPYIIAVNNNTKSGPTTKNGCLELNKVISLHFKYKDKDLCSEDMWQVLWSQWGMNQYLVLTLFLSSRIGTKLTVQYKVYTDMYFSKHCKNHLKEKKTMLIIQVTM